LINIVSQFAHSWDVPPKEAAAIQNELRRSVIREDTLGTVRVVAGIDVGFEDGGKTTRAAVVLLNYPELEELETSISCRATTFPYVPGLLSFREAPVVLEALSGLRTTPDLLMCDGQGLAHPRHFGLACHLGLPSGLASVGVAKSRLTG
jgi:deoxyribonuclease V